MAGTGEERRQELVRDLLTRFHLIMKIARVYEPGNRLVQEQIGPLYRALALILHHEGAAVIRVHHNDLFFNRTRLRFDLSNQHILKFIAAELTGRGVAAVAFGEGVTIEEMSRFIGVLGAKPSGRPGAYGRSLQGLSDAKIAHITLEPLPPDAGEAGSAVRTIKAYFLGIHLLRDVIERQRRKSGVPLGLARRWMQAMIRHFDEEEALCLGLTTLKNADGYHANHGVNAAVLATALGRRLGLPRKELVELGVSALTHDLGTLEVSPAILEKPASLTEAERAVLDRQSALGAQKLIPLQAGRGLPGKALEVALEHRLRMDQSNRPSAAPGASIHLFSRMVRIADAYDALTTRRVYRPKAFTPRQALDKMAERSGTDFDPVLLKAFTVVMGPYPVGTVVALESGEIALVVETHIKPSLAAKPKVRMITDTDGQRIFGPVVDLAEEGPEGGPRRRSIALVLDADAYGIRPVDYFTAAAL